MTPHSLSESAPGSDLPLAVCHDAARTYGRGHAGVVAVHGASATVPPGARIAIVGPSGSGKSTLVHLLAGLEQPTAGSVEWPGLGVTGTSGRGSSTVAGAAVIFQAASLVPTLDVLENVLVPLQLAQLPDDEADARAHEALSVVGIADLSHRLPDELSGGQAERVAVARALATRPRLLLADEPTGQLDAVAATRVVDALLAAVAPTGAALVISTHDTRVADRMDEQWHMTDGRLYPHDLEEDPR